MKLEITLAAASAFAKFVCDRNESPVVSFSLALFVRPVFRSDCLVEVVFVENGIRLLAWLLSSNKEKPLSVNNFFRLRQLLFDRWVACTNHLHLSTHSVLASLRKKARVW